MANTAPPLLESNKHRGHHLIHKLYLLFLKLLELASEISIETKLKVYGLKVVLNTHISIGIPTRVDLMFIFHGLSLY